MKILLIHGLGRTPLSMSGLAAALQLAGHETELFGYMAWLHSFDDIARRLRDRLQSLSIAGNYGVVSHSLGSILVRAALAKTAFPQPACVVMLAPPNQSPRLGRWASRLLPYQLFSKQCGANLASSDFYNCLSPLTCPYTIIAGTAGIVGPMSPFGYEANDMIVGLEETKMQPSDRPLEVRAFHSFIMNNPEVQKLTVDAFAEAT